MLPSELGGGARLGDTFTAFDLDYNDDAFVSVEIGEPPTDDEITCERAFVVGNDDRHRGKEWPSDARSMSVGDVVIVGESAYACESVRWRLLDADTVHSFSIRERTR
jgi:hypothetical protein